MSYWRAHVWLLVATTGCGVACPDNLVREGDLCLDPGADAGDAGAPDAGDAGAPDAGAPDAGDAPDAALADAASDAPAARYISGSDNTPVFHWPAVDGAVEYDLWVGDSNGMRVYQLRLPSSVCGSIECTTEPSNALATGSGVFWTRSYNAAGMFSEWSPPAYFEIP